MLLKWFRKSVFIRRPLLLEPLEERIVLDAAVAATAVDTNQAAASDNADSSASGGDDSGSSTQPDMYDSSSIATAQESESSADATTTTDDQSESSTDTSKGVDLKVVAISSSLENAQSIAAAVDTDAKVIIYDATSDTLQSLTQALAELMEAEGEKIDQLAIVSHGDAGVLSLGGVDLWTAATIQENGDQWSVLAGLLDEDARIDLYGCSVGAGEDGEALVNALAAVTGAAVWASDDSTGNVAGADWDLEVKTEQDIRTCLIDESQLSSTSILLADLIGTEGPDTLYVSGFHTYERVDGLGGDDTITNNGTVDSLLGRAGDDTITNYGTADWIAGGDGCDVIINYGTVTSEIYADNDSGHGGSGDDRIENYGTAGTICGGDGDNTFILHAGTVSDVKGGEGEDIVIIMKDAECTYDVNTYSDNDTVDCSGTVRAIYTWDGDDIVYLKSDGSCRNIGLGAGDDELHVAGTVKELIDGEGGTDTLYLPCSATSIIFEGDSAGYCTLNGYSVTIYYVEFLGIEGTSGNDTFTAEGGKSSTVISFVYGLGGNDSITVSSTGQFGTIWGDDGDSGTADGNDTITINPGASVDYVYGEGGSDHIIVNGTVEVDVDGGAGDDYITVLGGTVNGIIYGGDGTDTLLLSYTCTNFTGDATSGSCTLNGEVISWEGFEHLGIAYTEGNDSETVNLGGISASVDCVVGLGGNDTLTLTGNGASISIYGDDTFSTTSDGNDTMTLQAGAQVLNLYGEGGNDTIVSQGTVWGDILGGDGDDFVYFKAGSVGGIIDGGDGTDTLWLTYQCTNITGDASAGSCTYDGHVISWQGFETVAIVFTDNNDTATLHVETLGDIDGIYALGGNDSVTLQGVNAGVTVYGDDCGGSSADGSDTITVEAYAEIAGVYGEGGNDTIENQGVVDGSLSGGTGADQITNYGAVEDNIGGGEGSDVISNHGTVHGNIDGAQDNDAITNDGTVDGDIVGGSGNDTITIDGTVAGDVTGSSGTDSVYLLGGSVGGTISGGTGTDTLYLTYLCTNIEGAASSGTCVLNGNTISWSGFETLAVIGTGGNDIVTVQMGTAGATIDYVYGYAGNDQIIISGTGTIGTVYGDDTSTATPDGDDTITIESGAQVSAVKGGGGTDTLNITYESSEIQGNAAGGSAQIGGKTVSWDGFESLGVLGTSGDDTFTVQVSASGATVDFVYGMGGDDAITIPGLGAFGNVFGDDGDNATSDGNDSITLESGANVANVGGEGGNDTIVCYGSVTGTIDGGEGDDDMTLGSGAQANNVYGGVGNDVIVNHGSITDSILAGDGDDRVDLKEGSVDGRVEGGDGTDALLLTYLSTNIWGDAADGGSDQTAGGWGRFETLAVTATDGDDSFTVGVDETKGATIDLVLGLGGNDEIVLPSAGTFGTVYGDDNDSTTADGNDTITVLAGAEVDYVYAEGGSDTITNEGSVLHDIVGGAGNDGIGNEGTVSGNIEGGDGDDTIDVLTAGQVGSVSGGGGQDTITNKGSVLHDISGGTDDDCITNEGTVSGNIEGGDGDDTIDVLATGQVGSVSGGEGQDTLTNKGVVLQDMLSGPGDDCIANEGTVTGNVGAGEGDDKVYLTAGSVQGRVLGGAGTDLLFLGYGSTNIWGDASDGGSDEIHGGWGEFATLAVVGTDGDDTFTVSVDETKGATIDEVLGLGGNDKITIPAAGTFGNVYGDDNDLGTPDGDDTITISADAHVENVFGEGGNDTISNSGTVVNDILAGDGEDSVSNELGGRIGGTVYGDAPDTKPGDTLAIHVTGYSNGTGDASDGSLEDQDGNTIRWNGFEKLSVITPSEGESGSGIPAIPYTSLETQMFFDSSLSELDALQSRSDATAAFRVRMWETSAVLGPPWSLSGTTLGGHAEDLFDWREASKTAPLFEDRFDAFLSELNKEASDLVEGARSCNHRSGPALDLEEFLDAVNRGLGEGAYLSFNAKEMALAELFVLTGSSTDGAPTVGGSTGFPADWTEGQSVSFDLSRLRVADIFRC